MNIFDLTQISTAEEITEILVKNDKVRIERIISTGQVTGWYDQHETEFVVVLDGSAIIEYENGKNVALATGDTLLINPHEKHRVCYTSAEPPCVWLCVFY